ncbi:Uncharacterised protein [Achromobacter xylosoxidans]|nr:Uncharacterised protein [Achromobacter xylosoxidans]CUJ63436.1 Uncharacterised protein [Achromobacter xylosoxidans]CUJ67111.1 Uncharacterised protein [Achromobacter xylosoxidans]CUJ74487.1 Uncharacterised protein [Achromobacter xylosoxidans]
MITRLVQGLEHRAVDEYPTADRQHQCDHQQGDGDAARYAVVDRCLRRELVGALVDEAEVVIDSFAELGIDVAGGVVQVQIVLDRHIGQRGRLPLEDGVVLLERGFQRLAERFRALQRRRLAEGIHHLEGILHQAFGTLGLRRRLFGLALLHVHQRRGQQQARAQENGVGTVERHRPVRIGAVDLVQLGVAGIQAHPGHAIGQEHGTREEQQHQNDAGANFQIDKHEIPDVMRGETTKFLPCTHTRTLRYPPEASVRARNMPRPWARPMDSPRYLRLNRLDP